MALVSGAQRSGLKAAGCRGRPRAAGVGHGRVRWGCASLGYVRMGTFIARTIYIYLQLCRLTFQHGVDLLSNFSTSSEADPEGKIPKLGLHYVVKISIA